MMAKTFWTPSKFAFLGGAILGLSLGLLFVIFAEKGGLIGFLYILSFAILFGMLLEHLHERRERRHHRR